ncbi:protein ABHD14A isoform X3 [Dromiciops gliroides]|uniref:protein ABHD14A isoform X3 n=1 Tax=Dromiciops gliroides TaxID=33562 RepID=UPI001CC81308|nr:protein ABHD14A isoform X3 [Dromiciops gliroides]
MQGTPKLPKGVLLALGLLLTILLYLGLPSLPQPLAWTWDRENVTILAGLTHSNSSLFYREVKPLHKTQRPSLPQAHLFMLSPLPQGDKSRLDAQSTLGRIGESVRIFGRVEVVLLHGKAFTSHIWQQLGTLEKLSRRGYRAIALDLPGFGNSFPSSAARTEAGRADLLHQVLQDLEVKNLVLVSPSLSGLYSLPFLMRLHSQLCGFVPIAPTFTKNYTNKQFSAIKSSPLSPMSSSCLE